MSQRRSAKLGGRTQIRGKSGTVQMQVTTPIRQEGGRAQTFGESGVVDFASHFAVACCINEAICHANRIFVANRTHCNQKTTRFEPCRKSGVVDCATSFVVRGCVNDAICHETPICPASDSAEPYNRQSFSPAVTIMPILRTVLAVRRRLVPMVF